MELFHAIDVEGAREMYEKKNICQFVMAEWGWWSIAAMTFLFLCLKN
jgi:hypothetical protein